MVHNNFWSISHRVENVPFYDCDVLLFDNVYRELRHRIKEKITNSIETQIDGTIRLFLLAEIKETDFIKSTSRQFFPHQYQSYK